MAKTIIQTIGPLYGEVVNGTVFGRPNGSIFVPSQNTIKATLKDARKYIIKYDAKRYMVCTSAGQVDSSNQSNMLNFVAESQDVANYVQVQVATDSDFTDLIGGRSLTAGLFNSALYVLSQGTDVDDLVNGDTYYLRLILVAASGEPVATTETIELTGVVNG